MANLPLEARSDAQHRYLSALKKSPMVFGIGPAGTGKTYLSASYAIDQLAFRQTDRVIVTRATVPVSGEQLGYLPGDIKDKMDPWVAEIMDVFAERVGDEKLRQMVGDKKVQIIPFAFMRGRSFKNSIILCDEMQNATPAQTKMLVTRIGEGSKMLLNGDLEQSDLRSRNGLADLLDMIEGQSLGLPVIRFSSRDVRRSALCQLWVEAYEKKEAA